MKRILFYRIYGVTPTALEELHAHAERFAGARDWRGEPFWIASAHSRDLFGMEYFRHARADDGALSASGFRKHGGDETDALAILFFLAEVSAHFQARVSLKDEDNPIAKLRHLEFHSGRLPSGLALDAVLAARPVIKRLEGAAITFYPPTFRPHSFYRTAQPGWWGFSLAGMRDFAPSFLEAEAEAMRIYRGFRRLET